MVNTLCVAQFDFGDEIDVVVVYTDGACSGNPGPGGWAWAVAPNGVEHDSGGEPHSTNQRMEIRAAYEALLAFETDPRVVRIVSDSTYVVKCFTEKWWQGWFRRGWKNSQGKPIANRDLWEPFIELVNSRGRVEFEWVRGHSGDAMNERVDRLAVAASQSA